MIVSLVFWKKTEIKREREMTRIEISDAKRKSLENSFSLSLSLSRNRRCLWSLVSFWPNVSCHWSTILLPFLEEVRNHEVLDLSGNQFPYSVTRLVLFSLSYLHLLPTFLFIISLKERERKERRSRKMEEDEMFQLTVRRFVFHS